MDILKNRLWLVLALAAAGLSARGADDPSKVDGATIRLSDRYDRPVELTEPARRLVSLAPGVTETVFALGYGDRLIGRTPFCNYPPEAAEVPIAGNLMEPDLEVILRLDPDIVLASTHMTKEAVDRLDALGFTVGVFKGQNSFEGTYDGVIRPVAAVLGDAEAGERLVSEMQATVEAALEGASRNTARPRVYYAVGFGEGGDWTAGGDTFIGEMIEMAGGTNIAADVSGWSFSLELLVERDPDIILLPPWAVGQFESTPIYGDLRAVRSGRVYAVDEDVISRQGPRLADGLAELVRIIGGRP